MNSTSPWHSLVWDEEKIARFWNCISKREPWRDDFFSKQVGTGVVNFLKCLIDMKGRVLDYGCGPGHLVEHLLAAGITCEGIDFAEATVEAVNCRFRGHGSWKGARVSSGVDLPSPDGIYDLAICLETLEHVLPENMPTLIANLKRVLKPCTGMLFVTVPNAENMIAKNVFCPECGSVFHPYQHLSSFTVGTLEKLMGGFGFRTLLCDVTDFNAFQRKRFAGLLDWSPRETYRWVRWIAAVLMDAVRWPGTPIGGRRLQQRLGQGGHLFWLGTADEGCRHHED